MVMALTGDAVLMALPDQAPPAGEWIPLSGEVSEFITEGKGVVLAESEALAARGISADALIPGTRLARVGEIAAVLARADRSLIF